MDGRTIILTTHHLDEAEVLADRIGIMARGELLIVGTADYIKKKFGIGYHLSIMQEKEEEREFEHVKKKIKEIINSNIDGAKLDTQTQKNCLKFILPFST